MIKLRNKKNFSSNIFILILLNGVVFYNYWIGRSTPPWDFLGGGQVEQFRFYKDGSFFNPPTWFPYGWFGIPEFQMLQDGGWFLPVAVVSEFFFWNPPNAARVQAFLVLLGSIGAYLVAQKYVKDLKIALLAGTLYTFIPAFYSNAQHYGVVRSAALLPWVIYIAHPSFVLKYKSSILIGSLVVFQTIVGSYPGNLISIFYTTLIYVILNLILFQKDRLSYFIKILMIAILGSMLGSLRYLPVFANLNYFPDNPGNQAGLTLNNLIYILFPFTDSNLPWGDPSLRSLYIGPIVFVVLFFINFKNKYIMQWTVILTFSIFMMMQNQFNNLLRETIPLTNISRFAISDWRNSFSLSLILISVIVLEGLKNRLILMTKFRSILICCIFAYFTYLAILYEFSVIKIFFYLLPIIFILFYLLFFLNRFYVKPLIIFAICFNYVFVLDNSLSWLTTVKEQYFNIYRKDYSLIKETNVFPMEKRTKRFFLVEPPLTSDEYKSDQRYNRFWLTGGFGALGYHNIKDIPAYEALFQKLERPNDPVIKFLTLKGTQLILSEKQNVQKVLESCLNNLDCESIEGVSVKQIEFNRQIEKFTVNSDKSFLFVQNEMYSPVWSGNVCKLDGVCNKIKSFPILESLRSWNLPSGQYTFITEAKTPLDRERWILFYLGLFISITDYILKLFYSRRTSIKNINSSS